MTYSSYQVGELFEQIRNGLTVENDPKSGGLPITRIETIANGEIDPVRVGYSGIEIGEKDSWLLEEGDILFSHINSLSHIGKCAIYQGVPEKLIHGMNLLSFRPRKQILLPEYALYLFRSNTFKSKLARSIKPSVNQASVGIKDIQKILVDIPPLATQKHIAQVLEQADQLRKQAQQMESELNQLAQSLFLEMFGDPVSNPKGLRTTPISDVAVRVTKGESPNWQGFSYQESGVRFVTSENVRDGELDERVKFIPNEFHEKLSRSQLSEHDLLVNLVGASVARSCLVPSCALPANINQAVCVVTFDDRKVIPAFVLDQLTLPSFKRRLIGETVEAARANLSLKDIRDTVILCPGVETQRKYMEKRKEIDSMRIKQRQRINLLNETFESLMQRAFKGELTAPGSKAA